MSGEPMLERSVLERKERDELHTIAEALGVKPPSRTKKADLIDHILRAAGVETSPAPAPATDGTAELVLPSVEPKPRRRTTRRAAPASPPAEMADGDASPPKEAAASLFGDQPPAGADPGLVMPGAPSADDLSDADADADADVSDEDATLPSATVGAGDEAGVDAPGALVAQPPPTGDGFRRNERPEPDRPRTGNDRSGNDRSGAGEPGGADRQRSDRQAPDRQAPDRQSPDRQGGGDRQGTEQSRAAREPRDLSREVAEPGNRQGPDPANRQGPDGSNRQAPDTRGGPGNQPFDPESSARRSRRRRGRDRNERDMQTQEKSADQQYQGDLQAIDGYLDLSDQGYGFLRTHGYLPHQDDAYLSVSQVRRFALRKGDRLVGEARPAMGNEKYGALLRIETVSGLSVEDARQRPHFEDLTPLFPDSKLRMEMPGEAADITARIIDLISPIGKGQRGMIVSPPKAGKTTVIKQIATSIEKNNPEVHLMVLLVDERPEEVTDMRRTVKGEVIASTFDRPSDEHTLVAELAIERAKRLVEVGQDVVIILDGITRLARAYNLSAPASGRLTSGGIDQAAIYPPKKFFGAARNIEEGGSLTILATALVETGSKADDVIFEEFKGTGNMELRLDRRLAERRVYPAIDVNASSTRHEELLFDRKTLELVWRLRRVLNGLADDGSSVRSLELLIEKLKTTRSNDEFLAEVAKAQSGI